MTDLLSRIDRTVFADPWQGAKIGTVTPPNENPISGVQVILGTLNAEFPPGAELTVTEVRRTATMRRAQVPSLPRGTLIAIGVEELTVDSLVADDGELVLALVH